MAGVSETKFSEKLRAHAQAAYKVATQRLSLLSRGIKQFCQRKSVMGDPTRVAIAFRLLLYDSTPSRNLRMKIPVAIADDLPTIIEEEKMPQAKILLMESVYRLILTSQDK